MLRHPFWSQAKLAAWLRELHAAVAHPDAGETQMMVDARGVLTGDVEDSQEPWRYVEIIPGDGKPFDATAAARRLLAAWRDAQPDWRVYPVDKLGRRKRLGKNWC